MNEHNNNFYSLAEIKRTLEATKEFEDGEELYYHIGTLRYANDEIERLNNIIDELEKYFAKPNKFIERPERMKILDKLKELKEGK